jgi:DNA-binding NtrC family response regulator
MNGDDFSMDTNQEFYQSLTERIKESFPEIDSDIATDLRKQDEDYLALFREIDRLQNEYPVIMALLEGEGKISMTAEEHAALVRYLCVMHEMEDMERRHIYFRGHSNGYAYLKEIGAI